MIFIFCLLFLFFPITAWAYFDPGFGGYLFNSIISLIVTGFAFAFASVIYFFRTIIGQNFVLFSQKHKKLCLIALLSILGIGSFSLSKRLHHPFHKLNHSPFSGARVIDPERISPGYNLYNGHLIDLNGKIIKNWPASYGMIDKNGYFYAMPNIDTPPWGRYTWDNHVIWKKNFSIHNGIWPTPQGSIFVFTKETHDYNNYKVGFDVILEFDKSGRQLQRYSLWDHREEFMPYHAKFDIDIPAPINISWLGLNHKTFDYFHLNCLTIIPPNALEAKDAAFRRGNWLISLLHGSMVFILDQDSKKILWHMAGNDIPGSLQGQHSVSLLPDGDILLFENGMERKNSRVLLIDPLTFKIKWQYNCADFYSENIGFVQALPNGNILITSSQQGHVFEVTPNKETVWEFYSPEDKSSTSKDKIYSMIRYPKEMVEGLQKNDGSK